MNSAQSSPVLSTTRQRPRLVIAYKNFGAYKGLSHIGLGVSALQNAKMLRQQGYLVEVWAILSGQDLIDKLLADSQKAHFPHHHPVSHVVISAPWIPTTMLASLVVMFPQIEFAVVSHSNIGFLQADPGAIKLLREEADLGEANPNFHIAGNSRKLVEWWKTTYQTQMYWLPNMYPVDGCMAARHHRHRHKDYTGGTLRIGCFCAIRPYKNVLTAAAAALEIGVRLRVSELQFWISGGRSEGGGGTVANAIREMFSGVVRAKLVENNWESWPQFVKTVGEMDLLLQPSFTEGFNMVTADGISQGVPSVVSDAIDWTPDGWQAKSDAAGDVASTGIALLYDPDSAMEGLDFLNGHNQVGLIQWEKFLAKMI